MGDYHYYLPRTCNDCGRTRQVRNDSKPERCVSCANAVNRQSPGYLNRKGANQYTKAKEC